MLQPVFNCEAYWKVLYDKLPELSVVVRVGFASCATEAATERTFSSEGIMHNSLRNRLSNDLVQSLLKIRWNYEPCALISKRRNTFQNFGHAFSDTYVDESEGEEKD